MKSPELKRKDLIMRNTFVGCFAFGFALAFFTPKNILEYHLAISFVDVMSFIPYVRDAGDIGRALPIAQFFAAVMWAFTPVIFVFFWEGAYPIPEVIPNKIKVWQLIKSGALFFVLLPIMLCGTFQFYGNTRFGLLEVTSKLGLGIFGTAHIIAAPLFAVIFIWAIKNWKLLAYGDLDTFIKQNQKFH